jgi:hypothetical protein
LLESYGGRSFTVDRRGRDKPLFIRYLLVSLVGGIQPERLETMLLRADDDGLAARVLMVWPDSVPLTRPKSRPDDGPVERAFSRLLQLEMESRGAIGKHASALGKMPGQVLRLALVLEHIGWAVGSDPNPPQCVSTRGLAFHPSGHT